jgi:transcriptional regulator with XRE-family HTH domain
LHVRAFTASHIGKEGNLLEQQGEGVLLVDPQAVYSGEKEWEVIRSLLDRVSISELAALSGVSERMFRSLRKGERRPSAKTLQKITAVLAQLLDEAEGSGQAPSPCDDAPTEAGACRT